MGRDSALNKVEKNGRREGTKSEINLINEESSKGWKIKRKTKEVDKKEVDTEEIEGNWTAQSQKRKIT